MPRKPTRRAAATTRTARAPRKPSPRSAPSGTTDPAAIDQFLDDLAHPLRAHIEQVRRDMRSIDPEITESIKWNSLNFRRDDDFATLNRRSLDDVQFIFHTGARTRASAKTGLDLPPAIADSPMLTWLARDRALVSLGSGPTFTRNRAAFKSLVRAWLAATGGSASTHPAFPRH